MDIINRNHIYLYTTSQLLQLSTNHVCAHRYFEIMVAIRTTLDLVIEYVNKNIYGLIGQFFPLIG